jgi:L-threonylcarbamoyladenylate synthase
MELLTLDAKSYDAAVSRACELLYQGGLIAYPTETFYGLGVRYDSENTLARLFKLKQRTHEKAFTLIIGKIEQLSLLTDHVSDYAKNLIERYWPGPLTLLFSARPILSRYIVANGSVAVRIPGESFALSLAKASAFPITATSANIATNPPADTATSVVRYFNDQLDLIIDGGITGGILPSTIIDVCAGIPRVVRKGSIVLNE